MASDPAELSPPARGARLAVDVGTARIGVAASDPDGIMAFPVETVPRGDDAAARIAAIAADRGVAVVYVGLPRSLAGSDTASTADARSFAATLAELVDVPVRLTDERLSTVSATAQLHSAGMSSRRQRGVIDQAAAVVILEAALQAESMARADSVAPDEGPEGKR